MIAKILVITLSQFLLQISHFCINTSRQKWTSIRHQTNGLQQYLNETLTAYSLFIEYQFQEGNLSSMMEVATITTWYQTQNKRVEIRVRVIIIIKLFFYDAVIDDSCALLGTSHALVLQNITLFGTNPPSIVSLNYEYVTAVS